MALLSHYYQPDQSEAMSALAANDWLDVLGHFPQDAVDHACRSYLQAQPSRRPTPGDIRNRAASYMAARRPPPAALPPPPEKSRDRVSPEAAQRILERAGFTAERRELVKRFPKAPNAEALEAAKDAPAYVPVQPTPEQLEAARAANPLIQQARQWQGGAE